MKSKCFAMALLLFVASAICHASNIDATQKYAWAENAGWINFAPTDGGVSVYPTYLNGFAWCETAGWVNLGSGTGPYANTTASNYGVNVDASGNMSGYAWAENAGWINFKPTDGGVTMASDGTFSGYAWSETLGWISFQNASPAYNVQRVTATFPSSPTAVPNPAGLSTYGVGQSVSFSATGTGGSGTLTYTWTFGDGGTGTGANPTYAYATAGTYTVTVTVTDAFGNSVSTTFTVTVAAPIVGTGTDITGDGYSDSFLAATGFVPSQPATAGAVQKLSVSSTSIKLNFAKPSGNDAISMSGTLQIPAGFTVKNQIVAVDIGGVMVAFTLGANGASTPKGSNTFAVGVKSTKGVVKEQTAKYALKLTKGSFITALAADGLVKGATSKPTSASVPVPITVIFNGAVLQQNVTLSYKATGNNGDGK